MSDQGTEEKDLGAQDATVSAGDKPADTRIAPGVTEQNHTESEAGDASDARPKKRQLTSRTIAACAVALVAVFAGIGYATGLFGSAQPDEQVAQQQAQEQSASASSTSVKQSTSGQPDNSQDGGDKASSAEDGKAKDENSLTDSSQEQSEGSSSEQASQSGASSGGSGASGSAASNASENSGSASSSGSAPAYQEPEPEPAPAPAPSTISVHISIDSSRAQSYGLGGFSYGSTVYDALCATGASVSGSSYYVSAINGLAEKQCGDGSGWTYAVNGSFPGKACGRYALSGGESISWIYSTEKNPTMAM